MKLKTARRNLITAISKQLFVWSFSCLLLSVTVSQAQTNITKQNGETIAPDAFPVTGCVYNWTNDNPAIGLAALGSGDITAFKGINNGFTPIKAKITVTTTPVPPKGYGAVPAGLAVLDINTLAVKEMVPVPNGIYVDLSPNGNEIYVASSTDKFSLYVVSTANNQLLAKIPIPEGVPPVGLMMTPDGSRIYMRTMQSSPQVISWVNTADRTVGKAILPASTATRPYQYPTMSPDGSKIFLSTDLPVNQVTIFDTQTNSVSSTIDVKRPSMMIPTKDGKKLYIFNAATSNAYVYDFTISTLTTLALSNAVGPKLSPDGKFIYITGSNNGTDGIRVIDTSTDNISTLQVPSNSSMVFSKDGRYFYSISGSNGDVTVVSTADNQVVTKIPINASDNAQTRISYSTGDISYDGTRLYILNKVQFTAIGSVPTGRNYVSVINTADNTVLGEIESGTITTIKTTSAGACNSTPFSFIITVNPDPAVFDASGPVPALSATYGSASTAGSFTLSGSKIGGGILVTAPADFEVSTDKVNFSNTVTVAAPPSGDVPVTKVYARLKATARVNTYSGNITLSNNGTEKLVPIDLSTVGPASLTIKPNTAEKTYGATLTSVSGLTAFTPTGLKNGETIGSITVTYGSGSTAIEATGTYPGSATPSAPTGGTFLASNYTFTPEAGDLTVIPAPLTITADDKSKQAGDDNPILTFTYSGFVNGEDASQLTSLPTVSTTAVQTSPAGIYPITPAGGSAANYRMVYKAGKLTVIPKVITVSNTFTPNGDGINDTWEIKYIYLYPKCTVEVYNRNGNQILYSVGYTTPWNGKYKGGDLQTGTYYYVVNLSNGTKPITGSLTIIR